MGEFFRDHWKVMMIGLIGVLLGVFLNNLVRNMQNKKLLAKLQSELTALQSKTKPTQDEVDLIQTLKTEIYMLKFQCH